MTGFSASSQRNRSAKDCRRACSSGVCCLFSWPRAAWPASPPFPCSYGTSPAKDGSGFLLLKPVSFPAAGPDGRDGSPLMNPPPLCSRGNCCVSHLLEGFAFVEGF